MHGLKFGQSALLVGGTFLVWQAYKRHVTSSSEASMHAQRAFGRAETVTPLELARLEELTRGRTQRWLNVNNFGLEELEVSAGRWRSCRRPSRPQCRTLRCSSLAQMCAGQCPSHAVF
jgi:hypothetical protein